MFVPVWLLITGLAVALWLLARARRRDKAIRWALQDARGRAIAAVVKALNRRNAGDPQGALEPLAAFIYETHDVTGEDVRAAMKPGQSAAGSSQTASRS